MLGVTVLIWGGGSRCVLPGCTIMCKLCCGSCGLERKNIFVFLDFCPFCSKYFFSFWVGSTNCNVRALAVAAFDVFFARGKVFVVVGAVSV